MWWTRKRSKTLKEELRTAEYDKAVAENQLRDALANEEPSNSIVARLVALRIDNNWAPALEAAFADRRFGGNP